MQCAHENAATKLQRRRSEIKLFQGFYTISLSELFTSGSTLYFTVGVDAMFGFRFFWSFDFCEIISIRAIFVLKHTISSRFVRSGIRNGIESILIKFQAV